MSAIPLLDGRMPPQPRLRLLSGGLAADSAKAYLVGGEGKVLRISPPEFPNVISEMTRKAALARDVLGPTLGRPIPLPLEQWEAEGVSCALFEELAPVSRNVFLRRMQLRRIVPLVLEWLRNISEVDRGVSEDAETNLRALMSSPNEMLRAEAESALSAMRFVPSPLKARVMHGDMWIGNVLLRPSHPSEFTVIDWGGSNVDGLPIFDLIKFAEGVRLSPRQLRTELSAHAAAIDCQLEHTRIYLLAALGSIWRDLGEFPAERFAAMAEANLRTLDSALNA